MGKGDIKTKRGKITNGTFGKLRKHKNSDKSQQSAEKNKAPKK